MKYLKSPIVALLYLIMLILKLDGKTDVSWFLIFAPILIDLSTEVFKSIVECIWKSVSNLTTSIKRNQELNTRYNGQRLYWDAKTNTMYGPGMEE